MKKACFVLVAFVMVGGFFVATADAGQLCWQVDSTNDDYDGYLSLMASAGKWTKTLHGVWYVQGANYLPVSGNMIKSTDGIHWRLQVSTTVAESYLAIAATLYEISLSGTGQYIIISSMNTGYSATFTKISCKEIPPYAAP